MHSKVEGGWGFIAAVAATDGTDDANGIPGMVLLGAFAWTGEKMLVLFQ